MYMVAVFIAFMLCANAAKLPAIFQTCSRTDPEFQNCLQVAIEDAFHKLASGYPKLGLTPLEPLAIPLLHIGRGNRPLSLNLIFRNVKISGITTVHIKKQNTDLKALKAEYHAFNKKLILEGDYEIDGKILLLPIRGKGKGLIELIDVEGIIKLNGSSRHRRGQTYFDLKKFDYRFNPEKMVIKLDNLFNGDRKLTLAMNRILNNHWKEVLREVRPGFEEALSEIFKSITSNLFNRIPLEEIYPIKK